MPSLRSLALVLFSPLALVACGSSGTVAIELTDAAPVLSEMKTVEVSLGLVEVHVYKSCHDDKDSMAATNDDNERGEWVAINEKAGTFDLLSLQNDVTTPLGEVEVWGEVNRIRMHIDTAGTNQVTLNDGRTCALDMSARKGGIDISHPFEAVEPPRGGRSTIVVDFDIEESINQTDACSFALEPVLKIKRINTEEDVASE
jgi:hypothetical protein